MKHTLECNPAGKPTHQSGIRYTRRGKPYKTKKLLDWEAELMAEIRKCTWTHDPEKPVRLTAWFMYPHKQKKFWGMPKATRPDTDNLIKTVKDVLTQAGVWKDDSLVVWECVSKIWGSGGSITLEIEQEENG